MASPADRNLSSAARNEIEEITAAAQDGQMSWADANAKANEIRANEGADYTVSRDGVTSYDDGSTISNNRTGNQASGGKAESTMADYDVVWADSVTRNSGGGGRKVSGVSASAPNLGAYLDQWLAAAQKQQVSQIDYATEQGVKELTRAEKDAQPQFQEQRNQIDRDEARAKDNQALYAEARGDKGGIGAAQYDAIMATAAQNRLKVSQAQTKLSTDTARQIADLRAQGQFEKADALLATTQQYLSQLIALEQWSAEYGLSVAQFNASLQQWQAEYEMAVADLTGYYKGAPTLANQKAQDSVLASAGETLLAAGILPSTSQLAAMGLSTEQARDLMTAAKLSGAKGSFDLTDDDFGEDVVAPSRYTGSPSVDLVTLSNLLSQAQLPTITPNRAQAILDSAEELANKIVENGGSRTRVAAILKKYGIKI